MKKVTSFVLGLGFLATTFLPMFNVGIAHAASLESETFGGVSTTANQWLSGGTPSSACLTAATTSAANSVPACSGGPSDTIGNGALRLTSNAGNQSGFAIYNTPLSSTQGLQIAFDTYQYNSSSSDGADGISFFLIDGADSPTQPGALGGSLGYASGGNFPSFTPGIVGGYVGVGLDVYGNFSNSDVGSGGPGPLANAIGVRGSEASDYQFVSNKAAAGQLDNPTATTRSSAKRHVVVTISSNNIMSVSVDYNDGHGLRTELSSINLNTINGADSLPPTFKFGFAASTGGSNETHEIQGLSVQTLTPNMSVAVTDGGGFKQGQTGQLNVVATNNASAEPTTDTITVTNTLPAGLTPTSASGTGWTCGIAGQVVTCSRPGDGANALQPGVSAPTIAIHTDISSSAPSSLVDNASVATTGNSNTSPTTTHTISIAASGDTDGITDIVEAAAPNGGDANGDGTADSQQPTVTSFVNSVTSSYAALASTGCTGNNNVSIAPETDMATDDTTSYSYPAGLMNFTLTCTTGATATITQYYYGLTNSPNLVLRKYNTTSQTYSTVTGATFSSVTIGGQQATKVTYQITDGGPLDADGTANGTIVDPAGPALQTVTPAAPTTSSAPTLQNTGIDLVFLSGFAILCAGLGIFVKTRRTQTTSN